MAELLAVVGLFLALIAVVLSHRRLVRAMDRRHTAQAELISALEKKGAALEGLVAVQQRLIFTQETVLNILRLRLASSNN